jgi:hypothetical protein
MKVFLAIGVFALCACGRIDQSQEAKHDQEISDLRQRVDEADKRVSQLEEQMKHVSFESTYDYTMLHILTEESDNAEISTSDPGYGICKINGGFVLIKVNHVDPYLDGLKITLQIGNPLYSDLTNCSLKTSYGPDTVENEPLSTWKVNAKSIDSSIANDISAGRWTNEEVIIPAVDPAHCRHLSIHLECGGMKMLPPLSTTSASTN